MGDYERRNYKVDTKNDCKYRKMTVKRKLKALNKTHLKKKSGLFHHVDDGK